MEVVFRADSSIEIGSGHVMRTLVLADELRSRGASISYICRDLPGNLISLIERVGYPVAVIPSPDSGSLIEYDAEFVKLHLQNRVKVDWLVVDHYSLGIEWESLLREAVSRIMVIDDLANRRHDCDLLLDQGYLGNNKQRYEKLVPRHCRCFVGPAWFLLRSEFMEVNKRVRDKSIGRILVSFGGSDSGNATTRALASIVEVVPKNIEIDVVVGAQNPHRESICKFCDLNVNMKYHIDTTKIALLINAADLAVGSVGVTALERLYMRVPSFVTPIALNQNQTIVDMENRNMVKSYSNSYELSQLLLKAIDDGGWVPPDVVRSGTRVVADAMCDMARASGAD